MEILRRRLTKEVGQWETSCNHTFSELGPQMPNVACRYRGCGHGPKVEALQKRTFTGYTPWRPGGAACEIDGRDTPPC